MRGILAAALLSTIVVGCASGDYEARLASWVGRDIDQLVTQWGPPSGSHIFADGRQVVTYRRSGAAMMPGGWQSVNTPYGVRQVEEPGLLVNFWCETTFTTDARRIIQTWAWRGNNCG